MDPARLEALLHFYQTLTPSSVAEFGTYYTDDAWFKDPFNEVRGLGPIRGIFERMFRQVSEPKFKVTETVGDVRGLFLVWEMSFRMKVISSCEIQVIRGVSHLRFAEDGKVSYHRDYWDTGDELYSI
jgi:hypothetical protein